MSVRAFGVETCQHHQCADLINLDFANMEITVSENTRIEFVKMFNVGLVNVLSDIQENVDFSFSLTTVNLECIASSAMMMHLLEKKL